MATDASPIPTMKKLPFEPTALGRAALVVKKNPDDDGLDLFRRSKEMAPTLLADQERRRKKRKIKKEAEKAKASAEKAKASAEKAKASAEKAKASTEKAKASAEKRRRDDEEKRASGSQAAGKDTSEGSILSRDAQGDDGGEEEELNSLVTPPSSKRKRHEKTWSPKSSPGAAPLSQSSAVDSPSPKRRSRRQANLPPSESPDVEPAPKVTPITICIESDDEDIKDAGPSQSSTSAGKHDVKSDEEDEVEEENEFAKYVQRAKEQRDLARSQTKDDMDFGYESTPIEVLIYISSNIKDTKPALVKVNYDGTLKDLRRSWFRAQQRAQVILPSDFTDDDAILTWCDAPVYNNITLRDLGIRPCGPGKVIAPSSHRKGIREDGQRVLMNIWTSEGFRNHEEQIRQKREAANFPDDEGDVKSGIKPEPELKITFAARDLGPKVLNIYPSTTVDTAISMYKRAKNMPSTTEVTLWFDGEMLEEHVTMGAAEIDDMDTIEVHIKQ